MPLSCSPSDLEFGLGLTLNANHIHAQFIYLPLPALTIASFSVGKSRGQVRDGRHTNAAFAEMSGRKAVEGREVIIRHRGVERNRYEGGGEKRKRRLLSHGENDWTAL
jgi:hypothetical protein